MKRFMAILLALTLLLCSAVAFATVDNQEPTRQSDYFASYGTSLSAIGGGKIKVTFSCSAVGTATTLGVVNYEVQRKDSSGNWEDVSLLVSSIGNTFSGRKLSRWRVEIFRQGKVGKTANPAQPENTTRP